MRANRRKEMRQDDQAGDERDNGFYEACPRSDPETLALAYLRDEP